MTIDEFARITLKVITADGLDGYMPTVAYPARRQIGVLQGALQGQDLEQIAVEWAARGAQAGEEFLVAFRSAPNAFKVVRCVGAEREERVFELGKELRSQPS